MRPESSAASWVKFFTAAGINTESAEHYAVTFSKNQIQLDMLPEINKDYLNDMGISLLGHIIAILRHAKTVYADEVRKSELPPPKKPALNGPKEKLAVKSNKPTTKPVELTTKPVCKSTTELVNKSTSETSNVSGKRKSTVIQLSSGEDFEPKSKVRKKLCDSSDDVTPTIIKPATSSKSDDSEEIKKGVFRRLGSEVIPTSTISDGFPQANGNNESVFSRLGGKSTTPQVAKVAALNITKRVIGNKTDDSIDKFAATKSIMRTRLDKTKKRILVGPTYMDSIIEERKPTPKLIRNSFRSASANLQEKKDIKTRLGSSSSKLISAQFPGNVKKVSFGCVFEKLIPRVKKPALRNAALSINSGSVNVPVGSLISQRLTRPIATTKTISLATTSGVFSRLGR